MKNRPCNDSNQETTLQKTSEQWIPECLSVGFIAKRCGVSNTTVLRWISMGQLIAFRLPGGHFRVEREEFSEFLTRYHMPSDITQPEHHL
jgi:excisionase family DNA binding protein